MPVVIRQNRNQGLARVVLPNSAIQFDQARKSDHPGLDEARRLMAIVEKITKLIQKTAPLFTQWQAEWTGLVAGMDLETLAGEARLEALSMELRGIWLRIAHWSGDAHLKSPLRGTIKKLPLGKEAWFYYERCVFPHHLESRCERYHDAHADWEATHLLFRCGMSALIMLLHGLMRVCKPTVATPLYLGMFGGYYETTRALQLFFEPLFFSHRFSSEDHLLQSIREGKNHILLLEPVPYDWEMVALDLEAVLGAMHARADTLQMVIVDSTIVGPAFPMAAFLQSLRMATPPLVVQLHSGLKLDQEGLELANVGVVTLYAPKRSSQRKVLGEKVVKAMREDRKIVGNALSMDEMAILDVPFFLDREAHFAYCQGVFYNNRLLAQSIQTGGLFSRIIHPALSTGKDRSWAVAPFVIFHFQPDQDSEENHKLLIQTLVNESSRRGFVFSMGMSFGFRTSRFELIKPYSVLHPNGNQLGLLKVAMGRRMGPVQEGVIQLLQDLACLPDFQAIKVKFPDQSIIANKDTEGMSQSPNTVINGTYLLEKQIGVGTFGEVFKARSVGGEGVFAIKRATTKKGKRVLGWEMDNLTRLRGGPHILSLHDHWIKSYGPAYLVTEFLDGGDLKTFVQARGHLPEREALTIMEQIGQALAFAHALVPPIVHRDVKPDNILGKWVDDKRMIWYLADWGLAESWQDSRAPRFSGTPRYTAPEVWQNRRYLVSDVYSLGMTLYFMLFGQPAYNGESEQVARCQQTLEPVVIPAGCPAWLHELLAGVLEKDLAKRWSLERVLKYVQERRKRPVVKIGLRIGSQAQRTWQARYASLVMDFVWIPGGSFFMGMESAQADHADRVLIEADKRCLPRHLVTVYGFWMAKHPVTRGQFRVFIEDSGYQTAADREGWAVAYHAETNTFEREKGSNWEKVGFVQDEDHPVVNISYQDAVAFGEWLGMKCNRLIRIPSEAEWEYACRGKTQTRYSCGDEITFEQANFAGHYRGTTAVKRFFANGYGLYDMHGNVYEWVRDWYEEGFYARSIVENPVCSLNDGPGERVLRGGSWHTGASRIRCASRDRYNPDNRDADIGFRLSALPYPWET